MIHFTRSHRVGGLIQKALSDIIQKRVKDPRLEMVTITRVKMTRDLRLARIYFSTPEGEKRQEAATNGFRSASGFVKRTLARQLGLRYMPDLQFFYDDSFDYSANIDRLLNQIRTEDGTNIKTPR
jgi:ribosome-binding factor A